MSYINICDLNYEELLKCRKLIVNKIEEKTNVPKTFWKDFLLDIDDQLNVLKNKSAGKE